jgi:uncharacterized membrane protein
MEAIVERLGAFALVGLASSFASGLFGVGGGIVRIPIFVYLLPLFGVAHPVLMHVAVGTSIALVLPSAVASTRKQLALGNLDVPFFKTWAVGIFVGVLIGTVLVPFASTEILQAIFAAFMVALGVYEGFFKNRMVTAKAAPRGAVKLALAAAIGLLAALTGTGGGTLTTPALQAFSVRLEGRDRHGLGDRAHHRRRRHHRRDDRRLARARSARLFAGLCRPRDLRRDDADDPDRGAAGRARRSLPQRGVAAAGLHRPLVRHRRRPHPQAGELGLSPQGHCRA